MPKNSSQNLENSAQQLLKQGINPDHTFENFLANPFDSPWFYTCKSAAAIADESTPYNPLFLHGSIGSGKTHLAHAIANELFTAGHQHLICTTGEAFCHELIASIRNGNSLVFREKYQQVDALIIDDIDYIAGKDRTAQEFRHIYDSLCLQRKPLIVTASCSPVDTFKEDELLRSRFTAGQVVCIPSPDAVARKGYLQSRLSELHIEMDAELSDMLVSSLPSIRELQGAINALHAYVKNADKPVVDAPLIQQLLNDHRLHAEGNEEADGERVHFNADKSACTIRIEHLHLEFKFS